MDAMHLAFTRPLITEDAYKEALRVHFLEAFDGFTHVETSDLNLLELHTSYAYLLTYAEYRNGMLRDETSIAKHFVTMFHSAVVEEGFEETNPDTFYAYGENVPTFYTASIPGVVNLGADEVMNVVMQMSFSVARELVNKGNIPLYFDIALGYQHGDTVEVQGNSVYDATVIFDDRPRFGGFIGMPETWGDVGRGLSQPRMCLDHMAFTQNLI